MAVSRGAGSGSAAARTTGCRPDRGRGASIESDHHGGHRMSSETPAGSPPEASRPLESQVETTPIATVGQAEVSSCTEARTAADAPSESDGASGPADTETAPVAAEAAPYG